MTASQESEDKTTPHELGSPDPPRRPPRSNKDRGPHDQFPQSSEFVFYGAMFESVLIAAALVLGYFGFCDPQQPLSRMSWSEVVRPALLYGAMATLPLFVYIAATEWLDFWPFKDIYSVSEHTIKPLFREATIYEIALISILAGWGEELLFRWSIQGGIGNLLPGEWATWGGLWFSAVLFGACHYLNLAYALLTFFVGLYLGGLMILTGTWLTPAVTHAIYDFVAILHLTGRLTWKYPNP